MSEYYKDHNCNVIPLHPAQNEMVEPSLQKLASIRIRSFHHPSLSGRGLTNAHLTALDHPRIQVAIKMAEFTTPQKNKLNPDDPRHKALHNLLGHAFANAVIHKQEELMRAKLTKGGAHPIRLGGQHNVARSRLGEGKLVGGSRGAVVGAGAEKEAGE